jgi:hypothetical protein
MEIIITMAAAPQRARRRRHRLIDRNSSTNVANFRSRRRSRARVRATSLDANETDATA